MNEFNEKREIGKILLLTLPQNNIIMKKVKSDYINRERVFWGGDFSKHSIDSTCKES